MQVLFHVDKFEASGNLTLKTWNDCTIPGILKGNPEKMAVTELLWRASQN
jgi:hypothetical protein